MTANKKAFVSNYEKVRLRPKKYFGLAFVVAKSMASNSGDNKVLVLISWIFTHSKLICGLKLMVHRIIYRNIPCMRSNEINF